MASKPNKRPEINNIIKDIQKDKYADYLLTNIINKHNRNEILDQQHLKYDEETGTYLTPDGNPLSSSPSPSETNIVDNLVSTSTTSGLSANQGRVLDTKKADLVSPILTGIPTAPTAIQTTDNNQIATTAFVKTGLNDIINVQLPLKADLASANFTVLQRGGFDVRDAENLPYEQGSWTPIIYGDTVSGTPAYSVQVGSYYRFGNFVLIDLELQITSLGGMSGPIYISGLPYVVGMNVFTMPTTSRGTVKDTTLQSTRGQNILALNLNGLNDLLPTGVNIIASGIYKII
jgi:hypothetical protein